MEAPMLPDEPKLVKCPQCKVLVWIDELQEIEQSEYGNQEVIEGMQNYIEPSADDYFTYLENEHLMPKREFYIRIRAWWAGNGCRRRGGVNKPLAEREIRNLLALAEMLEDTGNDSRVMKAEMFREIGLFNDACYLILERGGKDQSLAIATILGLLDKKQSHVAEIVYK